MVIEAVPIRGGSKPALKKMRELIRNCCKTLVSYAHLFMRSIAGEKLVWEQARIARTLTFQFITSWVCLCVISRPEECCHWLQIEMSLRLSSEFMMLT